MHDEDLQQLPPIADCDSTISDPAAALPVAANGEPNPISTPRPLQFSIAHILLWTFVCAIVMSVDYFAMQRLGTQAKDAGFENRWVAMRTFHEALEGAILSGLAILVARRLRGATSKLQPGEWLLITQSIGYLEEIAFSIFRASFNSEVVILSGMVVQSVVMFLEYLLPALLYRERGAWRRFFAYATFLSALWVAANLRFATSSVLLGSTVKLLWAAALVVGLGMTLIVIPIGLDIRRKTRRGWLHWLGVGACALLYVSWAVTVSISFLSLP